MYSRNDDKSTKIKPNDKIESYKKPQKTTAEISEKSSDEVNQNSRIKSELKSTQNLETKRSKDLELKNSLPENPYYTPHRTSADSNYYYNPYSNQKPPEALTQ